MYYNSFINILCTFWSIFLPFFFLFAGLFSVIYHGNFRNKEVALKVLRLTTIPPPAVAAVHQEINKLFSLRHPRVLSLRAVCADVSPDEALAVLVFDYMSAGNLFNLLHSKEEIKVCYYIINRHN